MKAKILNVFTTIAMLLLAVTASHAQSAYYNAVLSLGPAGYWPMHETNLPTAVNAGDIETNYGTIGLLGTGYYPDWAATPPVALIRQHAGPFTAAGQTDVSVNFTKYITSGQDFTNGMFIPHTCPSTTLNPPFSVECWFFPTNTGAGADVWSQCGSEALNAGPEGGNIGTSNIDGIELRWVNNTFVVYALNNGANQAAGNSNRVIGASEAAIPINQWYDVVVTCSSTTNIQMFTNGVQLGSTVAWVNKYVPDSATPLIVGNGDGSTHSITGYMSEFAVYTNVLQPGDIQGHYHDGLNVGSAQYFADVMASNPAVYLRMNSSTYGGTPATASLLALQNLGTTNGVAVGNGVYSAGTVPGILSGPTNSLYGIRIGGVTNNSAQFNGVSSFGDAGSAPAYNPTGSNANFTVTALFRGYPCDGRIQSVVSHGTNSWQLDVTTNGTLVFNAGNGNKAAGGTGQSAGDIETHGVYNDGNWHQVVAMAQTNLISIYVDGLLDTNGTPNGIANTNIIAGNAGDVMIGSDPTYTNNPSGVGRQLNGQVCEVAFFNNALSAGQVQLLYSNCQVAPYITRQPVSAAVNQGSAFTDFVTVQGSSVLAYQWYTNGVALAGQTGPNLILNPVEPVDAVTNYYLIVTNLYGSATSAVVSLTVFGAPAINAELPITYTNQVDAQNPNIVTNLLTLYAGANPTFTFSASGPSLAYYWTTNGVPDAAATTGSLPFTNVQVGTFNVYCVVSNFVGEATSVVWSASVIADPLNSSEGPSPYPQQVLALNPIGYWRMNDINLDGPDNGDGDNGYACHDYAGGNDGMYSNIILGGVSYNPTADPSESSVLLGYDPDNDGSGGDEDANSIAGINFASGINTSVAFTVEAWVSGFEQESDAGIVTLGYNGAEQFDLDTGSDPSHAFRFLVQDASGVTHTVNSSVLPDTTGEQGPWYHVVGVVDEINSQSMTLYINGQSVGTAPIASGSGILPATTLMNIGARMSSASSGADDQFLGNISDVAVFNYALTPAQVAAEYVSPGVAPALSSTPQANLSFLAGSTLTIPIMAVGTPPLGYYWYNETGGTNIVSGTTNGALLNTTLTLPNIPANWSGDTIELVVTNAYGTTNATVSLTVTVYPAQITLNLPSPVTVVQGNSYVYSVGAFGFSPLAYQWYSGASPGAQGPLLNATNPTYTVTAGAPGTAYYSVVVTNLYGSVTSTISAFNSISDIGPTLTSGLETNLLLLKPAGYWPMHETEAAAPGDTEVNYGSLGPIGNGYYPDWVAKSGAFLRQQHGPMFANVDPDTAVDFTYYNASLPAPEFTNGLYIPHNSPLTTLNPPFTVECWYDPVEVSAAGSPLWSQTGDEGLNTGYEGGGAGGVTGIIFDWAQNGFVGYILDDATNVGFGNPQKIGGGSGGTTTLPANNWYYVAITCDASLNMTYWTNGVMCQSTHPSSGDFAPDYWTPLSICSGVGNTKAQAGFVSEFAVYTNALQAGDIYNHYAAGINPAPATNYFSEVMNDNPAVYLRMNSTNYTPPALNFWPVLFNYGSAGVNGVYNPGTLPGMLAGPVTNANTAPLNGLSGNVSAFSGVSSYADAGYAPAFNPTGSNADFSVTAWFRGNPCDGRYQAIAGHGTNSWQLTMLPTGNLVFNAGNGNKAAGGTGQAAGDITTIGIYNDGNWHQVVAVNQGSVISIYVDGNLDTNGTPTGITAASVIAGNANDVIIGSDPSYTNTPAGVGSSFAGQICEVAFFTNALSAGEVSALYAASANPSQVPAYVAPEPPLNVAVSPGGTLSLTAGAAGTANVGYQWQFTTNGGGTDVLQKGAGNSPLSANLSVPSIPVAWNNGQLELTVTNAYGTNSAFVAVQVANQINLNPTNIVAAVTNNQLYLSWPADHIGWQLQAQTNKVSVGLSSNWVNYNPSTGTNLVVIPINVTNGTVFYRLTY